MTLAGISCQKRSKSASEALPVIEAPPDEAVPESVAPTPEVPPGQETDGGGSYSFDEKEKTPEDMTSE